ncbi:adenylate/guanylate cyclase domain-containing protein [Varunaivibrio sulfuroxidans]|nr:adenylate/guanylate cyclase domain-containing protein [Varunaivibrio sulfuroxidans]WES31340.1 adenylate/guanylate cyclase domain-containing protein [Varunaivibrio sulfuroxidans]
MSDIVDQLLRGAHPGLPQGKAAPAPIKSAPSDTDDRDFDGPRAATEQAMPPSPTVGTRTQPPQLSLDQVDCPAYMVNNLFELEWYNRHTLDSLLSDVEDVSSDITERNLFGLFLKTPALRRCEGFEALMRFHLAIAKNRMQRSTLLNRDNALDEDDIRLLAELYDDTEAQPKGQMLHCQVNMAARGAPENWYNLYASFFREGLFFVYAPLDEAHSELADLLARRDIVIRDLLKKRRPYLTHLSVLVADLQNSVKICAELPPEEYFELINQIWSTMAPKLRKYYATHGKHVGDGMVYYFFPQPDCNYILNAMRCAFEMKAAIAEIDKEWRKRKNWMNVLKLNIGLVEGREWFGTYQTPTQIEFTVLGDSINMAGRLSDFAREGAIWVTKSMLGQLSSNERDKISYGIRRKSQDGAEILVPNTYSRVSNLIDLNNPKHDKFHDIAVIPVAEILDIETPA